MQLSFLFALTFLWSGECASRKATTPAPKGGDLTDECPQPNGFFADGYQCDKYYECRDGVIEEKLCPDGMVFNDYSPQVEKCDLPFNIDCSERPERQAPKPSPNCPRQNGYFAHDDPGVCDKFYYCVDGKYNMITCPAGLVYNENTGICTWPDEAKKKGCSSQDMLSTMLSRTKRIIIWPEDEFSFEKEDKLSEENTTEKATTPEKNEEKDNEIPDTDYDYDYEEGKSFPEEAGSAEEDEDEAKDESSESNDESSENEDYSDEITDEDYEELDQYIKAYVEQMNDDPIKPAPPADLAYYEDIAEQTYKEHDDARCNGKVFKFDCPKVDMTRAQQHPRYPDPEDCQFFYVCINGETPRRNGCKHGQVFNEASGNCDWPRNVPECQDWYKGILTDEELYALEHPKPRTRTNSTAANQRRGGKPPVRVA